MRQNLLDQGHHLGGWNQLAGGATSRGIVLHELRAQCLEPKILFSVNIALAGIERALHLHFQLLRLCLPGAEQLLVLLIALEHRRQYKTIRNKEQHCQGAEENQRAFTQRQRVDAHRDFCQTSAQGFAHRAGTVRGVVLISNSR